MCESFEVDDRDSRTPDTDEVFWEHIDRVVIDKLKLEFDRRDYTDNGKVVNFEGDEE